MRAVWQMGVGLTCLSASLLPPFQLQRPQSSPTLLTACQRRGKPVTPALSHLSCWSMPTCRYCCSWYLQCPCFCDNLVITLMVAFLQYLPGIRLQAESVQACLAITTWLLHNRFHSIQSKCCRYAYIRFFFLLFFPLFF